MRRLPRPGRRPPWLGFCATEGGPGVGALLAAERALVVDGLPARRAEFATGRWCARAALDQLGAATGDPLLPDQHGAPRWPPGVVGSITHTTGWTAAVVARTGWRWGVRGVGLDAEPATRLPPGVLDVVASALEQERLADLARLDGAVPWDTVLFTAKEAAYKAWYPLGGTVLPHDAVDAHVDPEGGFTAVVRGGTPDAPPRAVTVRGRWAVGPAVVVSLAVVG